MSRAHVYVGFSDNGFYDHFESMADIFQSPLIDMEIVFRTTVFHWDGQGGLIHTSTHESRLVDAYREVGHLEWDPAEHNVLHCMDTDSDKGGDGDSNSSQSSQIDRFVYFDRSNDPPRADLMAIDPKAMVDNGTEIPKDPVTAVATNDTGAKLPLEKSAARALRAPDSTLHR